MNRAWDMVAAIILQPVLVHIVKPKFITGVGSGHVTEQEREFTMRTLSQAG